MTTLYVQDDTPEARNFLAYAATLPFVDPDNDLLDRIPGLARTPRECLDAVDEGAEDARAGRIVAGGEARKIPLDGRALDV